MWRVILFLSLSLLISVPVKGVGADPVTVFAAASTQQAVDTIIAQCPDRIGVKCRAVYAASSTLARQIASGAPADIFISANQKWMQYLAENAFIEAESLHVLARNKLVVIAPSTVAMRISNADDLIRHLSKDRIALGDPAHVPAGIYAKQALVTLGAWDQLKAKTLRMPHARAALAVVARGEANSGIVYATDAAITPDVKIEYTFDAATHAPIEYPIAFVKGRANTATKQVFALFSSASGRAIFKAAGFDVEVGS